jgi:hypothetical protein
MADTGRPKEWQSSIIYVIGLIFICGMTYSMVKELRADVTTNTGDIKSNMIAIHENELVQTEINTKLNDIPELKADLKTLTNYIMQNWEFKDKGKD